MGKYGYFINVYMQMVPYFNALRSAQNMGIYGCSIIYFLVLHPCSLFFSPQGGIK
jgi:hypothetical protein